MTAGIKANVDGSAAIQVGGSDAINISSGLNVGVGTSSPFGRLHVESSSGGLPLYVNSTASAQNARIRLNSTDNASSVSYVMSYSHASLNKQAAMLLGGTGAVGFYVGQTAGAEPTTGTLAQTIDSSGNVGIGTSSPGSKLDVAGSLSGGQLTASIRNLSNTANSDARLYIEAYSNSRFSYTQYGVNGVGSWNTGYDVASGSYKISNDGGGSLNTNTRMFIDTSGNFAIPTSYNHTTASAANVFFRSDGYLQRSTSALKYKQDVRDYSGIDINALRPVLYKSKCDGDDQTKDHLGIVADEAHEAGITELVTYGAEGEVEGFQYERLTVVLLKAMQEQQQMIETLQAKVAALEGA